MFFIIVLTTNEVSIDNNKDIITYYKLQLQIINYNYKFILFTLFGTNTQAYGSSIVLKFPPHLLTLIVNR